MKFSKALFAILFLLVAFSQQIWTSAQFSMPMSCSDEKESCVWYEETMTAQTVSLFFILPSIALLVFFLSSAFRASQYSFVPLPLRVQSHQRSRVQRE